MMELNKRPGTLSKLLSGREFGEVADLDVLLLRKGHAPLPSTVFIPGFQLVCEILHSIFAKVP